MTAVTSFIQHYGNRNTVLIVLGDHQPWSEVSGARAEPRGPDFDHRPRPVRAEADLRVGLERRPAAKPQSPGLADERLP